MLYTQEVNLKELFQAINKDDILARQKADEYLIRYFLVRNETTEQFANELGLPLQAINPAYNNGIETEGYIVFAQKEERAISQKQVEKTSINEVGEKTTKIILEDILEESYPLWLLDDIDPETHVFDELPQVLKDELAEISKPIASGKSLVEFIDKNFDVPLVKDEVGLEALLVGLIGRLKSTKNNPVLTRESFEKYKDFLSSLEVIDAELKTIFNTLLVQYQEAYRFAE